MSDIPLNGRLKRVISRMRPIGKQRLGSKPTRHVTRSIELRVGREGWIGTRITVREIGCGQPGAGRTDISRACVQSAEVALKPQTPGGKRAVAEAGPDGAGIQRRDLVIRAKCRDSLLETIHVPNCVCGYGLAIARCENVGSGRCLYRGQFTGRDGDTELYWRSGRRRQAWIDCERRSSRQKVVLPDVGRNRGDCSADGDL